jgi:putative ABC transport system permease protein
MTFIVRMVRREIRASWRRLLLFFVCIAVGVASIVAVRSVVQSVRVALAGEARALAGADVTVSAGTPFSDAVREQVAREQASGRISVVSEATEVATMVRPAARPSAITKMVELRAVQEHFPLYGTLTLREGAYSHALLRDGGVLVRPELLAQLGLAVGDDLLIGTQSFEIRGVIEHEPGRNLGAFSLGPRVFIDHADLERTGLLTFGSRASHELLLAVPGPDRAGTILARDLTNAFGPEFVRVRSYRRTEDRMSENLGRAENYLSLVGLVVLILGGIGVWSVTRVFVQQKVRSIAILKCVGSTSGQVLSVYVAQVLLLGLAGSLLGVALAAGAVAALPVFVGELTTLLPVELGLTGPAVMQGVAIGLLVSLLFSVVPLLDVRHVKPSLLLRQDVPTASGVDWLKWGVTGAVAGALVGVAVWQAGSLRIGLVLSLGFVVTALVLHATGSLLIRAIQPLRYARSFALRQAVLHVARPGNQTRVILLAVGLGAFFILGVRGLQENLLRDFAVQAGEDSPDMFLMDVQQDQQAGVAELLRREGRGSATLIPVLRARIVGVRGGDVAPEDDQGGRGRGRVSREYTVTYRDSLQENERLLEGTWWGDAPVAGGAEVSIEENIRERFGVGIGDDMDFDVLGRIVTARVASVREVDFRDFRAGGFMLVFRPGSFDGAPHTYIAAVQGPMEPEARARMQGRLIEAYPNVSVIDLREVLETIQGIVQNVTLAVTIVGALVLLSGALILVGAVSMTKFRRVYEAAILKTLGATSRLVAAMLLLEYGVLGALAGTVGALGAVVLGWAVARFALDLPWQPTPLLTAGGILACTLFVAAVGVLASLDVLRHKPLATLRAE